MLFLVQIASHARICQQAVNRGRLIIGFVGNEMELRREFQLDFPAKFSSQETRRAVQGFRKFGTPLFAVIAQR